MTGGGGHAERSILLLGSSLFSFSDAGPEDALPALLEDRLRTLAPHVSWRCHAEILYQTESAPARAVKAVKAQDADVVVFELTTYQFVHRAFVTRLRRRRPRLYGPALVLMELLKRAGGNEFEGGSTARGLLFRAPRSLMFRLAGGEAEQDVETSMRHALATLDEVLRLEQPALIVSAPKLQWREPDMKWCLDRIGVAAATLARYCSSRRVPMYDVEAELAAEGRRPGLARDALHYDRATRDYEAAIVAREVLRALNLGA